MGDPTWSGGSSPSMGFAHPRSSGHTSEAGGLLFLRMETGAGPSMRNSEKGAWKPSWEEAWVVSRGEGRVNRAAEPGLEGPGQSCKEEEESLANFMKSPGSGVAPLLSPPGRAAVTS